MKRETVAWLALATLLLSLGCAKHAGLPELSTIDGKKIDLAAQAGHVMLVNRWATWCEPCRNEIPELVRFGREMKSDGLVVFGLNDEDASAQATMAKKLGIDYPLLIDPGGLSGPLRPSGFVPESFLFDRSGALRAVVRGFSNGDELEGKLKELIAEGEGGRK